MKKITLSLCLLLICLPVFKGLTQDLQLENFDGLTLGDVGTDLTGTTAGQGGLFTVSDEGTNSDFQIIDLGGTQNNVLQITMSASEPSTRFIWKDGLPDDWDNRLSGNDIIEVEYDFYTGPTTDFSILSGMRLYNNTGNIIAGYQFNTLTKALIGLMRLDDGGMPSLTTINLDSPSLILDTDTWYRIGFAFNTNTGRVSFKGPGFDGGVNGYDAGTLPFEVDFFTIQPGTGSIDYNVRFDNLKVSAVNTESLLDLKTLNSPLTTSVKLYPNPVRTLLNFSITHDFTLNKIDVIDLNGRLVKSFSAKNFTKNLDVSQLRKGFYLIDFYFSEGKMTKKFVKL